MIKKILEQKNIFLNYYKYIHLYPCDVLYLPDKQYEIPDFDNFNSLYISFILFHILII